MRCNTLRRINIGEVRRAPEGSKVEPVQGNRVMRIACPAATVALALSGGKILAPGAPAQPPSLSQLAEAAPTGQSHQNIAPPVKGRDARRATVQQVEVRGFRVQGVGEHPRDGITFASMQVLADAPLKNSVVDSDWSHIWMASS